MNSEHLTDHPWTSALCALRDGEPGAAEHLQRLLAPLASAVLWKRCAEVVGDGLAQRAWQTVHVKVIDKVLPLDGEGAEARNRGYVRRIVQSRFHDLRRQEHRASHRCGNDRIELDDDTLKLALDCVRARQLCQGAQTLDAELVNAAELLSVAVAIRQVGAQEAARVLEVALTDPQFHRAWRLQWRAIGRLCRALQAQGGDLLPVGEARRLRKLVAWLGEHPLDLPPNAKKVQADELEDAEIERVFDLLDRHGVLRRIAKDSGPQGLSEELQRHALRDMLALRREVGVTVPLLLGCARDDPEFPRRRNALYQVHSRVRTRIAAKVAWLANRGQLDEDACAAVESLLRYLGQRERG